ncbi:MAG TPA: hypothetical protein VMT08_06615 [Bradyrhizobium sp.]|nr:hypothetical protein [Bradyrhizobium sp.]
MQALREYIRLRPAVRFREDQIFSLRLCRARVALADVVRVLGKFHAIGGKFIQQDSLVKIRRNDEYRFIHRSGYGLVVPAFPAMLPLTAVKFERDDD